MIEYFREELRDLHEIEAFDLRGELLDLVGLRTTVFGGNKDTSLTSIQL